MRTIRKTMGHKSIAIGYDGALARCAKYVAMDTAFTLTLQQRRVSC